MNLARARPNRVIVYSHDTYGLGHLRRSLLLAGELVARPEIGSVLVATGSSRAQSFHLPAGVDTLKLPSATKAAGAYRPRTLGVSLPELVDLRAAVLGAAIDSYEPDLILVDNAPVGMAGELWPLVRRLVAGRTRPKLVLGLRDIIDTAAVVDAEWRDLDAWRVVDRLYDRVLVYGDGSIVTTAQELGLENRLRGTLRHVGYVGRRGIRRAQTPDDVPTIVVTVGGGGDGEPLLRAYARVLASLGPDASFRSIVVTGPLLSSRRREEIVELFESTNAPVTVSDFVDGCEDLFAGAAGVIAMAGYNTVCEILASGAPALLVPREQPRAEQLIRAERLAGLGVVEMARLAELDDDRLRAFTASAVAAASLGAGERRPSIAIDGLARAGDELVGLLTLDAPVALLDAAPPLRARGNGEPRPVERPRVGYVLKKFPRLSETFILNEVLGLERAGTDVRVFSLRSPDDEPQHAALSELTATVEVLSRPDGRADVEALLREAGVASLHDGATERCRAFVGRLPGRTGSTVLQQAIEVARQVQAQSIGHLHAHFMTVAAHTAYVAHLLTGVPFTVTAHAKDIYRETVDGAVFSEIAAAATALVTVCEANRAFIHQSLLDGVSARVEVIYNGIPVASLPTPPPLRRSSLVLGVGRLVEKKGFSVLVQACRLLRERGVEMECVIVGEGEGRAELEDQIRVAGLGACIRLAGPLPGEQVLELMAAARVVAAPCITGADGNRDALPTVLLEALAAGTPVVATPVGGIPEIIDHGVEGIIVDERDADGLADALAAVLSDDVAWLQMAAAALRKASSRFDRRTATARLRELIVPVSAEATEPSLTRSALAGVGV